ncbi:monovalent cation/H+ antiporter subunit D [Rhodoplanes tepidamans]|uniref:Monovalent cation/H+ antiporter subunit D n=2 Tax=Rhodoplanes TaxID=29407 RepID=A0ABT5JIW2_RHOTP|nr:monovalent cation/H+ antiporter subunit D [Rhodoplanes tepidamans]MDC7789536.1 monovalent cation/H+ antiporter subunit D [Rhodoplanes tepidamans]
MVLAFRHRRAVQRILSVGAAAALLAVAIGLYAVARDGDVAPYYLGHWPAPFGIVLVLDRLSATMLVLTAALGLAVAIHSLGGWDARGRHFHPLLQFQLMGLNGAFLTGDVFNLFVFFEGMLIASYGLMLHGGGPRRLTAGLSYVAINLTGSTLFLFAVGLIYAVTGTLNMADLAARVATVAPGDEALLRTGALLLLVVFGLKAALVPLHWWLPGAYGAAAGPVAALFMIMTKVGAYSILRVYVLVFGADAGAVAGLAAPYVLPAALATLVVGAAGVLASRTLAALACFAVVWSMGSLLVAFGLFDHAGVAAGLYYLVHSTVAGAALFLLVDVLSPLRGRAADRIVPTPPLPSAALFSGLFFVAAIAVAGLPPLSGFLGKLLVLDATGAAPGAAIVWTVLLGTSLVVILGFARAGSTVFWKTRPAPAAAAGPAAAARPRGGPVAVCAALLAATAALALFAGPVTAELDATARQVFDTAAYRRAVLPPQAAAAAPGAAAAEATP